MNWPELATVWLARDERYARRLRMSADEADSIKAHRRHEANLFLVGTDRLRALTRVDSWVPPAELR